MPREARVAGNERILREVNNRVRELEEKFGAGPDSSASFICECARLGCAEPVVATSEEYETVRRRPNQFLLCLTT